MKNYEKIIKENLESFVYTMAKKRIDQLNIMRYDKEDFMFECDNGNSYYWMEDAVKAEIEWMQKDSNEVNN